MDIRQFNIVDGFLEDFAPGLPSELPLPMIGGVIVGAVDGQLEAQVTGNRIDGPLLGITALSLDLSSVGSDLDLLVADNTVLGGGLSETLDLILGSGILPFGVPPEGLNLPFRAGLSGILTLSIGEDARMNNMRILGNDVRDHLLGITSLALSGGQMEDGVIANNLLVDDVLGITAAGILGGNLNRLIIDSNEVDGGGTRKLVPIIEDLFAPLPFEIPDFSLAGITLIGVDTPYMNDIEVTGNNVHGHLLGISALGFGDLDMTSLLIAENTLERNFSGVLIYGLGSGIDMSGAVIGGNQISGGGTAFIADLISAFSGDPIVFPNWGLTGVAVVGVNDAQLQNFVIAENVITNQLIGIGAIGWNGANLNDGTIEDNQITYGGIELGRSPSIAET